MPVLLLILIVLVVSAVFWMYRTANANTRFKRVVYLLLSLIFVLAVIAIFTVICLVTAGL